MSHSSVRFTPSCRSFLFLAASFAAFVLSATNLLAAPASSAPKDTSRQAIEIHREEVRNSLNSEEDFEYVIGLGDVLEVSIYGEGSMRAEKTGGGGGGGGFDPGHAGSAYGYAGGYGGYDGGGGGGYGDFGGGGGAGDQGNRGDILRGGSGSMRVRLDGHITLQHLGDVKVAGMTLSQLRIYLKKLYSPIFENPVVIVILKEQNSRRYFVMGQVQKPGSFYLDFPITLIQAIARANGFKDCGCGEVWAGNDVSIIRRESGREKILKFNYSSFISGQNLQQNILIAPGDTVIVP